MTIPLLLAADTPRRSQTLIGFVGFVEFLGSGALPLGLRPIAAAYAHAAYTNSKQIVILSENQHSPQVNLCPCRHIHAQAPPDRSDRRVWKTALFPPHLH